MIETHQLNPVWFWCGIAYQTADKLRLSRLIYYEKTRIMSTMTDHANDWKRLHFSQLTIETLCDMALFRPFPYIIVTGEKKTNNKCHVSVPD